MTIPDEIVREARNAFYETSWLKPAETAWRAALQVAWDAALEKAAETAETCRARNMSTGAYGAIELWRDDISAAIRARKEKP